MMSNPRQNVRVFKVSITRQLTNASDVVDDDINWSFIDLTVLTAALPYKGGIQFKLGDLPSQYTDAWKAIFEQVKLAGVAIKYIPERLGTSQVVTHTEPGVAPSGRVNFETEPLLQNSMAVYHDKDDGFVESYEELLDRKGRKHWTQNRISKMFAKFGHLERISVQDDAQGSSGVMNTVGLSRHLRPQWLDLQQSALARVDSGNPYTNVPYGWFKYALQYKDQGALHVEASDTGFDEADVFHGKFVFTYYVACKGDVRRTTGFPAP